MELRAFEVKRKERETRGSDSSAFSEPPSKETLVLLGELEAAKVIETVGPSRGVRMASDTSLIRRGAYNANLLGGEADADGAGAAGGRRSPNSRHKLMLAVRRSQRRNAGHERAALAGLKGLLSLAADEALTHAVRRGAALGRVVAASAAAAAAAATAAAAGPAAVEQLATNRLQGGRRRRRGGGGGGGSGGGGGGGGGEEEATSRGSAVASSGGSPQRPPSYR